MNEMYDMSIVTHNYGVMSVLGVVLVNVIMLLSAKDVRKYTRAMRIFMPIGSTAIGIVIFTGVVMMASKHLEFSTANIAMIIFAIILIFLEVKRSSKLKYLDRKQHSAFLEYKSLALKILLIEVAVTLSISIWMWI